MDVGVIYKKHEELLIMSPQSQRAPKGLTACKFYSVQFVKPRA